MVSHAPPLRPLPKSLEMPYFFHCHSPHGWNHSLRAGLTLKNPVSCFFYGLKVTGALEVFPSCPHHDRLMKLNRSKTLPVQVLILCSSLPTRN